MEEMNMFSEKGFSCRTVSAKLGTKDGLVQRYDGLIHYQGELGDFWYDPKEFEVLTHEVMDFEYLHYVGNNKTVNLPRGCISTRYMFRGCTFPEGFIIGNDFDTSEVVDMQGMFQDCEMPMEFSLGDKFDTSKVFDMAGMFANAILPADFTLGEKFTFRTAINLSNMFYCVEFPKVFPLNDFTFTANRDYADMFYGCKFPAGFWIGGFPVKQLGKIICAFTSKIAL